jgi:hypothetical protein
MHAASFPTPSRLVEVTSRPRLIPHLSWGRHEDSRGTTKAGEYLSRRWLGLAERPPAVSRQFGSDD